MIRLLLSVLALTFAGSAGAECFDVSRQEPKALAGLLSHRIFPGPPNYEDVGKGDAPEPTYVLTLDAPICLTGDADFTDPAEMFDEVHLVATAATEADMREMRDTQVRVELVDPMPAHTGHHHRPLVAWVSAIAPR